MHLVNPAGWKSPASTLCLRLTREPPSRRGGTPAVDGELAPIREQLFYMAGGIDQVLERGAKAGQDIGMVD
jgi:hypothetical protein